MRRAGDVSRPPRRTICGPSTGGWPTSTAGRSPSSPTAPRIWPTACSIGTTSRSSRCRWSSATRPSATGSSSARGVLSAAPHRPRPADHLAADARPSSSACCGTPGARRTRSSRVLLSGSLSGTYRLGAGGGAGGRDLGCPPGGQPVGLAGRRDAGAPGCGAGRVGLVRRRDRRGARAGAGQSGMLLTVDRYDNLLRSGRVSRGKAWIAGHAGREADPVAGPEPGGSSRWTGCAAASSWCPGCWRCWSSGLRRGPRVVRFGVVHTGRAGDGRAGADGAGRGVPAAGLLPHPRDGRARHPRGRRRLGRLLSGRGRHPRPARRRAPRGQKDRRACRSGPPGDAPDPGGACAWRWTPSAI